MTTVITRAFSNQAAAQAAADDLKRKGFSDHAVLVTGAGQDTASALKSHGISGGEATRLAEAAGSGAIVSVRAEFGEGQIATRTLDAHSPIPTVHASHSATATRAPHAAHHHETHAHAGETDLANEPAPFSKALGLRLLSHGAAPFSAMLGLSVLSKSQTPSVNLASNNPAPLSSSIGLPLLTKSQTPSVQLKPDQPAPLSTAVGWRLLSNNPAPFSSMFKLPLLTRDSTAAAPPHHETAAPQRS